MRCGENYIIGERRKANFNEGLHREFYFWRTYDKQEIDLIEGECRQSYRLGVQVGK